MSKQNGGIIGPDNVTTGGFNGVASGVFKLGEVTKLIRESKWPEPSPFTNTVPNSARFNIASSDKLARTSDSGNTKTFTMSFWVKRSTFGADQVLTNITSGSGKQGRVYFEGSTEQLEFHDVSSGGSFEIRYITNKIFKDPSAWYNIVIAVNTDDGTAGDRVKIYVNGVRETSFATATQPSSGLATAFNSGGVMEIGSQQVPAEFFGGYMAEVINVDGTQLAPTSFGETNSASGIWVPKAITGLTFGANGYYLKNANAGALGTDSSGNGNDFAVTGLTSVDQATDSPSNNFCTINSVATAISNAPTLSQGNLTLAASGNWRSSIGTFALTKGKWYWESKGAGSGGTILNGIASTAVIEAGGTSSGLNNNSTIGVNLPSYAYHGSSGGMYYSNTSGNGQGQAGGSWGSTYTSADLISIYLDLDNNKLYMAKNDTLQVSGVGYDIQAGYAYYPVCIPYGVTQSLNFGIGSFNATAVSSAVADANGFGAFEYDPSRGGATVFNGEAKNFLSLCTNNLNILE